VTDNKCDDCHLNTAVESTEYILVKELIIALRGDGKGRWSRPLFTLSGILRNLPRMSGKCQGILFWWLGGNPDHPCVINTNCFPYFVNLTDPANLVVEFATGIWKVCGWSQIKEKNVFVWVGRSSCVHYITLKIFNMA